MWSVNRYIRLFLEYVIANPNEHNSHNLFRNFAQRLYTGTFDKLTGIDPGWLCWRSRSPIEAAKVIGCLTDFLNWAVARNYIKATEFGSSYEGSRFDRILDETVYNYKREKSSLGHMWSSTPRKVKKNDVGLFIRPRSAPKVEREEPPAFPDERFFEFLFEGFKVAGRPNFRDMCITLLMHGAGFRVSEPFHLYVSDVSRDPHNKNDALVRIHDPSIGYAPDQMGRSVKGNISRSDYLSEKFSLSPRNLLLDSRAAGWKGGMYNGKYFLRAYWFVPEFGELFMQLWLLYMHQIARSERNHPFAFINLAQGQLGGMYGMAAYHKAHARACERIGLVVGKELGTTPHGHRHAYGRRLVGGNVTQDNIRRFMHHRSLDSQKVYTSPSSVEMIEALREAAVRLKMKLASYE
jgi:hypothetical protein